MRKRCFQLWPLFLLLAAGGRLQAAPPFIYDELPPRERVQEYNLFDEARQKTPEQVVGRESEQAFALGELLLDTGSPDAAGREMAYSLENFSFCGLDLADAPVLRARLLELLQRADLYREELDLFGESDDAALDLETQEESPIEELVGQNLQPATIDPRAEDLIEKDILEQKYDFPIFINNQVMTYLNYLTTGKKRDFIIIGLQRLEKYRDLFQRIFREEGLPQDLIYFGLIESNFNTNAYSRARAKGIWQFIQWTGRRYGLRVDWWVDERSDPEKSTRAACAYLKDLYGMFGDWYLVLAAYNSGEGRIQRILDRHPDKDYWDMIEERRLPRETRGYVPAILAAIIVGKNPERFDISTEPSDALSYITVEIPSPTDLRVVADTIGVPVEDLKELNPSLRRLLTPPDLKTYPLHVPVDTPQETLALLYDIPAKERLMWVEHRVARGDTLYKISRKYGVPVSAIKDFNDLHGQHPRLSIGQVLQIPISNIYKGSSRDTAEDYQTERRSTGSAYKVRKGDTLWSISRRTQIPVSKIMSWNQIEGADLKAGTVLSLKESRSAGRPSSSKSAARASATGGTYTVQKGDTLWGISKELNVSLDDLLDANGLTKRSKLRIGQRLSVPGGTAGTPTAASTRSAAASVAAPQARSASRTAADPKAGAAAAKTTSDNGKNRVHVVRKGDTLSSIARRYSTDVASLKRANDLRNNNIKIGEQLVIPD
jgi:membrane-bound lytic murein transglycosylase D